MPTARHVDGLPHFKEEPPPICCDRDRRHRSHPIAPLVLARDGCARPLATDVEGV